jgi:dipeptidyl aminopeptidase/acylaminoacyl peptidase
MLRAIEGGHAIVSVDDERGSFERRIDDLAYDLRHPPAEQFGFLTCPCFVLHGADDLNVPVDDAFDTARALWRSGNRDVELCVLPRADHSLQSTPDDHDERLRERMSMRSFLRPFHPRYPGVVVEYLARTIDPRR